MHSGRTSSGALVNTGTAFSRAVLPVAEHARANTRAEKVSLPADIWYLIAYDYLVDSPVTVEALSSINRQFHALLHLLKFRVVHIRLNTSSEKISNTSSARRFAQMVRLRQPDIVDHVQVLWIGHEEDVKLPAINDGFPDDTERRSLCYILSLPYLILKHLTLSFKHSNLPSGYIYSREVVRTIPRTVLRSILSALSLPSLSEVSLFMGCMPWKVYFRLQEIHIDTLNVSARTIGRQGMPTYRAVDWHSPMDKLRTLRIDESGGHGTITVLFPKSLYVMIDSARLTTLVLKSTTYAAFTHLPKIPCPTLITLKLYFISWHDCKFSHY